MYKDNCSVQTNGALDAAKIPFNVFTSPQGIGSMFSLGLPGGEGFLALDAGVTRWRISRGLTVVPPALNQFEPH